MNVAKERLTKNETAKDDLNLFKYDDLKFKLILLAWLWFLKGLLNPKQAGGSKSMYSLGGRLAPPPPRKRP